jgi:hypothetical protein
MPEQVSPEVEAFVAQLFPVARIIPLHPLQRQPNAVAYSDRYVMVLAAKTPETALRKFQTVATLISEPHNTLVRIQRNNETQTYTLYVHTDDPRKREWAIVSFPELAADFVTDEKGQVTFQLPNDQIPANWEALKGILRLPVAEFHLSADQLAQIARHHSLSLEETANSDYAMQLSSAQGALRLAVAPRHRDAPEMTKAVIKGTEGKVLLIGLHTGKGRFVLDPLPQELTIRLYC